MIEGIIITPLKKIKDERGAVMHMMRKDSGIFKNFGEGKYSSKSIYECADDWCSKQVTTAGLVNYYKAYYTGEKYK